MNFLWTAATYFCSMSVSVATVIVPADIGEVDADHGGGKLDRHALRDGAATVSAGDDELFIAEHFGHQAMQEPGRGLDRRHFGWAVRPDP